MDNKKHVDESWKEQATEEKDILANAGTEETDAATISPEGKAEGGNAHDHGVEINFVNYITSLGFQAMIFMGDIPNPMTNEVEKNLAQAKFLIDTLALLKEKTTGNLTDEESSLLESSVYELQMRYVQHVQEETKSGGEKTA